MLDNYRTKGLRKKLVRELSNKGITNKNILEAINNVPRHLFLDSAFLDHAYQDKAFPIGQDQTISHPYTVAYQTQEIDVRKGDKVLEIGTGSGYQTSILAELGADIFTIERHKELSLKAQKILKQLNYKASFFIGDGTNGISKHAPYDKIIVTAGAPCLPDSLIDQLKPNGKLIIPIGKKEKQTMNLFTKDEKDNITFKKLGEFQFVPLIGSKGW